MSPLTTRSRIVATAVVAALSIPPLAAQQALDRTKPPAPGKPPELQVPAWTKARLDSGAELIVSEKHDLPLVSFSLTFLGGASQFEPANRTGLAGITAAMLSEGTTTKDGDALSSALQILGTSVSVSIGGESGSINFVSTTARFEPTLAILADMLVNPTFPAASLERIRGQRLVALEQGKAQPGFIASRVYPRVLYGAEHPYGRFTTEESIKAITRDDVVALHKQYFRPGRALVTVVGDVKTAAVKTIVEQALAAWPRGGDRPAFDYPAVRTRDERTIYLVDKPGAAQSTVSIGHPGPPRSTPDYFALQVMNTMLGGMFQSRLNANIREEKGYSYGVGSGFSYGKGPGAFTADGDVVSDKTDEALIEFMKELKGILGSRPVTDDELQTAKQSLIQRLPSAFASVAGINNAITTIWTQGLSEDYYQQYARAVAAVTKEEVLRVAKKHIDPGRLAIVIVGDRASIEAPLKSTGIAPITILDIEGGRAGSR
jgi:predicted Zn-dependent peptidase